ncbi:MAG TPA: DUF393 domain-containing protein [candidate division Zixibacteria bacterium]|nr:DUF393 domain-containing protein [candidate division Zixibacteria bacterium]
MSGPEEQEPRGWVLYDGACGFCSRWVPYWEKTLEKRGFRIAPLQAGWVAERLGLRDGDAGPDLRLLLAGGAELRGTEAYRYLMRRIWWATPLYALSILPGLRLLFDGAYRAFADNRYRISRACRLPASFDRKKTPD